jgi:hypothetical protein
MIRVERVRPLIVLAVLAGMTSYAGWAQQGSGLGSGLGSGTSSAGSSQAPQPPPIAPPIDATPDMEANQARMRSTARQKQLVLDTQKLLALANELKVDVDKSTKDTMSLDVIRKADEIEKLAHSVKEKMKGN